MPHVVHKGISFSHYDARYSKLVGTSATERLQLLAELTARDPVTGERPLNLFRRIGTVAAIPDLALGVPPLLPTSAEREAHLYEHWLGYHLDGNNDWRPQWPNDTKTGWWSAWKGDAHEIFAVTLEKAIRVSLGLAGGPGDPVQRLWPISVLWICGSPKFEGWTTWRRFGAGLEDGHVQVLLVTPGIDQNFTAGVLSAYISSQAGSLLHSSADYQPPEPPVNLAADYGLWVTGHDHSICSTVTAGGYPQATAGGLPYYGQIEGEGGVVTVQPAEEDGGVRDAGRTW